MNAIVDNMTDQVFIIVKIYIMVRKKLLRVIVYVNNSKIALSSFNFQVLSHSVSYLQKNSVCLTNPITTAAVSIRTFTLLCALSQLLIFNAFPLITGSQITSVSLVSVRSLAVVTCLVASLTCDGGREN